MQTVIALFNRFEAARNAYEALQAAGFTLHEINLIAAAGRVDNPTYDDHATLNLPGIGPVLAAGPLVAALLHAPGGATAPGFVAEMGRRGIPETPAGVLLEGVRRGGALLTAILDDDQAAAAAERINTFGPVDLDRMAEQWRDLEATLPSPATRLAQMRPSAAEPPEAAAVFAAPDRPVEPAQPEAAATLAAAIRALDPQPFVEWALEIGERVETAEVQVQARVVEEAHVQRTVEDRPVTVRDRVRRQVVDIARDDEAGKPVNNR